MSRERKLTRRAKLSSVSTRSRRSQLQKRRAEQVDRMTRVELRVITEKRLVKTIKGIIDRIDNPRYRSWTRAVTMFDPLFLSVEPNPKKRRLILVRIFKLRPRHTDAAWVSAIWKYQSSHQKTSLRYAIKYNLINKKV